MEIAMSALEELRIQIAQVEDDRAEYADPERRLAGLREVLAAVEAWQEARRALLAFPMKVSPDAEQLALWGRLGEAEDRLMKL
jgi:hypothetical protein